jgi:hypothetical protein
MYWVNQAYSLKFSGKFLGELTSKKVNRIKRPGHFWAFYLQVRQVFVGLILKLTTGIFLKALQGVYYKEI